MDHPLPTPEQVWRAHDADEQCLTAPLNERMLDLARVAAGMRVLDLAIGRGEPAVRAAHRVGATGEVLGVDVAEAMLRMTQARADAEGARNLTLRVVNAEALEGVPHGRYDAALARRALLYLDAPAAALAADAARLQGDLEAAGFRVRHIEDHEVEVIEAATDAELVAWVRALGLTRIVVAENPAAPGAGR
jgi:SAM-dependent methyltransferase